MAILGTANGNGSVEVTVTGGIARFVFVTAGMRSTAQIPVKKFDEALPNLIIATAHHGPFTAEQLKAALAQAEVEL